MKRFKDKSSLIPNPIITLKSFHDVITTRFPRVKELKVYMSLQRYEPRLAPRSTVSDCRGEQPGTKGCASLLYYGSLTWGCSTTLSGTESLCPGPCPGPIIWACCTEERATGWAEDGCWGCGCDDGGCGTIWIFCCGGCTCSWIVTTLAGCPWAFLACVRAASWLPCNTILPGRLPSTTCRCPWGPPDCGCWRTSVMRFDSP